ncbi:MAG: hypothetical protein HY040_02640 [Planctomycetes bacterium]|nr:hypothetical protein [Planctomycetota bacterium]
MVTALIEIGTGLALLVAPSLSVEFLLGEGLSSPQALVVARVAGVALISVGVACWLGRNADRRAQSGLIAGMLIYNLAVPILLLHGWIASALQGLGLWPASILHAVLAIWCVICLRPVR